MSLKEAEAGKRLDAGKEKTWNAFMSDPATKLMVSMVPETNPPELLKTLLRSAFDAGHGEGLARVMLEIVQAMSSGDRA